MSIIRAVVDLELQGVELWLEGERLRYRAPKALGDKVRTELGGRKAEVVELLRSRVQAAGRGKPSGSGVEVERPRHDVVPAHGSAVRRIASGCAEGAVEVARIEGQALALGWSLGELWSVTGWYHERGLVSLLRPGDRVLEVRRDRIRIDRANALGRVEQSFGRSRAAAAVAPEGWWQPRGNRPAGAVAEEAESVTC